MKLTLVHPGFKQRTGPSSWLEVVPSVAARLQRRNTSTLPSRPNHDHSRPIRRDLSVTR